jgi:hypothetical protein
VWYASAFPLLLRHHLPVQAGFFVAYAVRLTGVACADFSSVHHGAAAARLLAAAMARLRAVALAAHGAAPGGSGLLLGIGDGADAEAEAEARLGCGAAVVFVQLVAGVLLPWLAIYCTEARARAAWLRRARAAAARRRWRAGAAAAAGAAAGPSAAGGGGAAGGDDALAAWLAAAAPLAAAGEAGGAFACLAPPAVPEPPGCADVYLFLAASVAAWALVTAEPPAALLRRAGALARGAWGWA